MGDMVHRPFEQICQQAPTIEKVGLRVNHDKCEVFSLSGVHPEDME